MHKKKPHLLQFHCQSCKEPISFSMFELESNDIIVCPECKKKYSFNDPDLIRQIQKFADLCRQLQQSEEILGNAAVGVDIGEHHVKIPYKILLTRLTSTLELKIGNQPLSIAFRFEPSKDFPQSNRDQL